MPSKARELLALSPPWAATCQPHALLLHAHMQIAIQGACLPMAISCTQGLLDEHPGRRHRQLQALPPHVLNQHAQLQLATRLNLVLLHAPCEGSEAKGSHVVG